MDDVSELFRAYLTTLNRASRMGHLTTAKVKQCFKLDRKNKRDTMMNCRRNIDENASLYITPKSQKSVEKQENKIENTAQKTVTKAEVPNKRLELLAKWKAEKQERKKIEKKNAKPIFKYYHVSRKSVSDISTANSVIKGKPIAPSSATKRSQFAPPNHKFRAPSGIKPLEFNYSTQPIKTTIKKSNTDINSIAKNGNKKDKGLAIKFNQKENTKTQSIAISSVPNRKNKSTKVQFAVSDYSLSNNSLNPTRSKPHRSSKKWMLQRNNLNEENNKDVNVNSTEKGTTETIMGLGNRQRGSIMKQTPKKSKTDHFESIHMQRLHSDMFENDTQIEVITKLSNISLQSPSKTQFDDVPNSSKSTEVLSKSCIPVSPFVTISRGKKSARQEYFVRDSQGLLDNVTAGSSELSPATGSESEAAYFAIKLNMEIERIISICNQWETYLNNSEISEEARSSINVVIGQSRLLMSKKFQQFRGLIDQCRSPNQNQKPITCSDLHGFWDMIYMQVEDLDKRFNNLNKLRENNWVEELPQKEATGRKARGRPKKTAAASKLKSILQAARKKKEIEVGQSGKLFEEEYYEVRTPVKQRVAGESNSARRSTRSSLLVTQSRTPSGSSPGLTMMKISQSIKKGQGLTPAKSILKADATKSARKKLVLFKEDKENMPENVFTLTPRRSTRLTNI